MRLLQVLLHLVRPGELLLADHAGKDFPCGALVVQESVPLEAVLVLEVLADLDSLAFDAAVRAVWSQGCVPEEVQATD